MPKYCFTQQRLLAIKKVVKSLTCHRFLKPLKDFEIFRNGMILRVVAYV
jgi:hypothetical protein